MWVKWKLMDHAAEVRRLLANSEPKVTPESVANKLELANTFGVIHTALKERLFGHSHAPY